MRTSPSALSLALLVACSSPPATPSNAAEASAGAGAGDAMSAGAGPGGAAAESGLAGDTSVSGMGATGDTFDGMELFLLFGQSNMEGVPKSEAVDEVVDERISVLAYDASCNGRTYNEWGSATPPLHRCWAGVGPGDGFAKTLAEAWPESRIGLVPCAISGVDIDFFRKGVVSARRAEFDIPPDNHWDSAYDMMLERARLAQQSGRIRGILFHQGESDSGNAAWVGKVAGIVADLKSDLGLADDTPFIAGELPVGGCCSGHNSLVNQLPAMIPAAAVASADGLEVMDEYHFDLPGQRILGQRYAQAFLALVPQP